MDYFQFLPKEIVSDILIRLPTETILECKSVCTTWRSRILRPSFSRLQLLHGDYSGKLGFIVSNYKKSHYFEYNENHEPLSPIQRIRRINSVLPFEESVIVGSCNGLVCFVQSPWFVEQTFNSVCICNPLTKEYVVVPEIKIDCADTDQCSYWATGFGYVSLKNEYKIVGVCHWKELDFVEVLVYTLGSGNGWKNLGRFNVGRSEGWGHSIFFNEALYWLDVGLQMIFVFDLVEEKFREHLTPPPLPTESNLLNNRIGVSDGFLFFTYCLVVRGITYYDTWILRKKNDDHDMEENEEHESLGWNKEFRIANSQFLAAANNGKLLTYRDNYLNICDTKALTSKRLVDVKEWICDILPHKNTLVSLNELGEKDTKIMEPVTRMRLRLRRTCKPVR